MNSAKPQVVLGIFLLSLSFWLRIIENMVTRKKFFHQRGLI